MSNKEKENNDFYLTNPDGQMQNVFESKNIFTNESKNFVQENNIAQVQEQEYIPEQFVQNKPKTISRGSTTNLNTVSGFFATTAVAVASSVVIVVAIIVASISNFQLFATTSDSLTFYVQGYLSEDNFYTVRLYNEEKTQEEFFIKEPFIQFYGLMPETTYTLEVVDPNTEEVVFTQEYTTPPQDSFCISFEPWIEDNILTITTFQEDMPEIEGVTSYTISVYDAKGNNIFEKTVKELDEEYTVQLSNSNLTPIKQTDPNTADGAGDSGDANPTTGDGNGETITTDDDVITEEKEEIYYVGIVYQKGDYTIGTIQTISNRM